MTKMNVPINKERKLGPKTIDYVFLGYAIHSVGYRFLIINSSVPEMAVDTIMESKDATFFENEFSEFCAEHGIIHERIPPYSPQSNGIIERKNHTLTELVNAMLETAGLSKEW